MSVRRMNVDVPAEVYDQYKEKCAKNHVLIKDEIFKFICASLDGKSGSQANIAGEEKAAAVEDLDGEKVETTPEKTVDLKPILEILEGLVPTVAVLRQDVDGLKGSLAAPQTCPKMEVFHEINKRFTVAAKLIDSLMTGWEHRYLFGSDKRAAADSSGIELLKTPIEVEK
ncbi:MAG: hypothetical protein OEZ18_00665 [Candidatus Bathyarchaeota archaeon]|nr:hypothetical protein [Candidatus Bathyarchaeota archaeon]